MTRLLRRIAKWKRDADQRFQTLAVVEFFNVGSIVHIFNSFAPLDISQTVFQKLNKTHTQKEAPRW
jgi:hypothetical protein